MFDYMFTDFVEELFEPVFSERNKNIEEAVYMQFSRLLNEAEGIFFIVYKDCSITF